MLQDLRDQPVWVLVAINDQPASHVIRYIDLLPPRRVHCTRMLDRLLPRRFLLFSHAALLTIPATCPLKTLAAQQPPFEPLRRVARKGYPSDIRRLSDSPQSANR